MSRILSDNQEKEILRALTQARSSLLDEGYEPHNDIVGCIEDALELMGVDIDSL